MSFRNVWVCAALVLGAFVGSARAQIFGTFPVGVLECEVPNMDTFVVHGSLPLPGGITFDPVNCPYSIYDKFGARLLTQWEPIAYRADGTLSVAEFLAVATRGSMAVGSRQRFEVILDPSADPDLPLAGGNAFVNQMRLRTKDVFGNAYEGAFTFRSFHRLGAAQVTGELTTRLLPVVPSAPNALPQLGAAQIWLSSRAGTGVYEMALNFHNASSQHVSWHIYFKELELVFPVSHRGLSMWPEPMAGTEYIEGTNRVIPLIKPIASGDMHFMEQRHERGFRYFLYPDSGEGWTHVVNLRQRIGWARALDVVSNPLTLTRTWSFMNPATPGYFTQNQPMPRLDHVNNLGGILSGRKNALWNEISVTQSVGEDIPSSDNIFLQDCFRNPFGVEYGGMTGGTSMNPFEGMETLFTGEKNGLILAYMVERCVNDRQPGAIYEDNGRPFKVEAYANPNGTLPWQMFNNIFQSSGGIVQDAPWHWSQADKSHENYVNANGLVPAYRVLLFGYDEYHTGWDPIDTQHMYRYSRTPKMLVFLDNDPLSKRRLEVASELVRATYYEGPGGRLSGMIWGMANIGGGFGREHAECGDMAANTFAIGGANWRTRWRDWFEMYHDVLVFLQTPGGTWEAMIDGKAAEDPPLGTGSYAFFRAQRPDEDIFTSHALRGVKQSIFGNSVDAARFASAHTMLVKAGENYWRLLWKWKQDQSGPACGGHWERVAVGPRNPTSSTEMFTSHLQHPLEQFGTPLINCDGYRTGLALTTWIAEQGSVTSEIQAALEKYWGTTNFLAAAEANGISNIWNNAALIRWIQLNY